MNFSKDSRVYEGAFDIRPLYGTNLPNEYEGARAEYLACRSTAWLGTTLCCSPVIDVSGADAADFLNYQCVNRDFSQMKPGQSKHGLMLNDNGKLIGDGVIMYKSDNLWRCYWLAPLLYFGAAAAAQGKDVKTEMVSDEYFYQVDGPKSLEIVEDACQCDLHDIEFARNKPATLGGAPCTVHRLGMSGCLAYEIHGAEKDAEAAYDALRNSLEKFGGKPIGFRNYTILNHTPGGYPNQFQHYAYAYYDTDPGLADFARKYCPPQVPGGSVADDPHSLDVTPWDIGWGYCVNMNHDFRGKAAAEKAKAAHKAHEGRQMVTLEWNTEDVGDVFMSQFRGRDVEPYDPIEQYHDTYNGLNLQARIIGSYVLDGDKRIGFATGRCYAFYERRMISLACIEQGYAKEGTELEVLWGEPGHPQKRIRAIVARFPYYQGEWRNETCDVNKLVPKRFE
ncbi:MAG: hypothetical protein ACOYJL_03080 [Tractidigestivibacter sp.]|jgi:glycine cleavage system aminomethyltransferase T|uniref:hypothetical protein n=1 Tax=Tractidigestivibacter sp. TaxID=2847320 RepID=UPI003D8A656A